MSEEKELQEAGVESSTGLDELADFVDFADLDALDTASNLEVFGDLGDLADLGDMPDLSKPLNAADGSSVGEDISEELPIPELAEEPMPIPGMEEEVPMPIPDMAEEEPVPVPDMAEEEPMPIPELAEEEPMSVPELAEEPMPVPDIAEEVPMLDSELAEDAPLPDMDEEVVIRSVDPEPNAPDIFSDDSEESLFTSFGDTDDAELSEDTAPDAAVQDEQPLPDLSEGELPDIGGNLDEMPDIPVGDAAELLGGMDLDLQLGDESEEEIPLAMEDNGDSGDSGLDSMLGGILGNLDLNGSMEAEDGSDPMANILGLGSNPFGEDVESLPDEGDMQDLLDVAEMMPEDGGDAAEQAEEKKPGFLKKVFGNVVTDEIAEQERLAAQKEEEEAAKKVEEDAKAKEEAEAKKAEKKAAKEAAKEEKKKEKEAKKAEKAAAKAEKKAKKKEEEEAAELEVVGKLNKVGVSIIVIATILFLVFEIGGTNLFSYSSAKKEALNYFDMGKYTEAYQKAIGTDMRNKDEESYNKIKVVMKVQQSLNAYQNYDRIQYYPEALDALLRGLKRYDANIDEAMELEVDTDMMSCRKQILTLLQEEFNLSEAEAYAIIAMDKEAYQSKVIDLGVKKKNN